MDFKEYLLESAKNTGLQVNLILKNWREEVEEINKSLLPLVDAFIKCNKGGKGIRGVLVKLGYEIGKSSVVSRQSSDSLIADSPAIGGTILKTDSFIFKVAAAYEILHTSILAHDDIMDQDLQRRGQPSLYQALGGQHYGISQAISLADAGFFLAVKIIAESRFEEKLKNQALSLFAKIMIDTSIGQMLDVDLGERGKRPASQRGEQGESYENMIQSINLLKTARYTISGPLKIGAILAGVKSSQLVKLDQFGENLGIAYQIHDDILDSEVNSVELARVKELEYSAKATSLIAEITDDKKNQQLLQGLVEYLVERSK